MVCVCLSGIRQLQLMLLKVALLVAVEFHINVEFVKLLEPPEDQENEGDYLTACACLHFFFFFDMHTLHPFSPHIAPHHPTLIMHLHSPPYLLHTCNRLQCNSVQHPNIILSDGVTRNLPVYMAV